MRGERWDPKAEKWVPHEEIVAKLSEKQRERRVLPPDEETALHELQKTARLKSGKEKDDEAEKEQRRKRSNVVS